MKSLRDLKIDDYFFRIRENDQCSFGKPFNYTLHKKEVDDVVNDFIKNNELIGITYNVNIEHEVFNDETVVLKGSKYKLDLDNRYYKTCKNEIEKLLNDNKIKLINKLGLNEDTIIDVTIHHSSIELDEKKKNIKNIKFYVNDKFDMNLLNEILEKYISSGLKITKILPDGEKKYHLNTKNGKLTFRGDKSYCFVDSKLNEIKNINKKRICR